MVLTANKRFSKSVAKRLNARCKVSNSLGEALARFKPASNVVFSSSTARSNAVSKGVSCGCAMVYLVVAVSRPNIASPVSGVVFCDLGKVSCTAIKSTQEVSKTPAR